MDEVVDTIHILFFNTIFLGLTNENGAKVIMQESFLQIPKYILEAEGVKIDSESGYGSRLIPKHQN